MCVNGGSLARRGVVGEVLHPLNKKNRAGQTHPETRYFPEFSKQLLLLASLEFAKMHKDDLAH